MMNMILYILEFFLIALLANFSLGSEEQHISIFSESPLKIVINKFLVIFFITTLLSVGILVISSYKNDRKILKKRIIQHSLYIIFMTILMLSIQYIQYGYI
jgi:glycerol uptake facilitator-like aquaporin